MKISILTICPEMFESILKDHVIKRAVDLGQMVLNIMDIRSFADGCYRKVDDSPYGGGFGMVMRVQPVVDAVKAADTGEMNALKIAFSPAGTPFRQELAQEFSRADHLILVCGHYEGMDERIFTHVDKTVSMGDYILSGGEIAAMAVTDAVARLLSGVLKAGSLEEESFPAGLLEHPQNTKPAEYLGEKVPEVLLSGNHEAVRRWRQEQALERTKRLRPDLLVPEQAFSSG